jgi:hypothetical protein
MGTFMAQEAEAPSIAGGAPNAGLAEGEPAAVAESAAPPAETENQLFSPAPVRQPRGMFLAGPVLRTMEIGLAIIALLAGMAAFWLQRAGRA